MKTGSCGIFSLILALGISVVSVNSFAESVPGETAADERLQSGVKLMITKMQKKNDPGCDWKVIDTKVTDRQGNSTFEDWTVKSCDQNVVYQVKLNHSDKPSFTFSMPKEFANRMRDKMAKSGVANTCETDKCGEATK
jgi:hypothetical protein